MEGYNRAISEDLLRAPNRKRKTSEECQQRGIRMFWDFDEETTNAMMKDVGVSVLEDVEDDGRTMEDDMRCGPKPTPPLTASTELVVPGAPRVAFPHIKHNVIISNAVSMQLSKNCEFQPIRMFVEPQAVSGNQSLCSLMGKTEEDFACDGIDPWLYMSDEIMLSVFCWLPKHTLIHCARVCKRWNRVSFDESLWRVLDLAAKTLKPGVVGRILDRGVMTMRLTKTKIQSPLFVRNALSRLPRFSRLQYLDVSMATISVGGLTELMATCRYLRKLSLETCPVNDEICRYIGENRNIVVLNLSMCQGLNENSLVPLCNNLKRLDSLNVAWTNLTRGAVAYLVTCLPPTLMKLNLSGCKDTIEDEDVQQLCNSCPYLKELDLSDCGELTNTALDHIITNLQELDYLAISRCYRILPSKIIECRNIPSLMALDIFGIMKDAGVAVLREELQPIHVNRYYFSSIARPTTGIHRTSIWGLRVRENVV